jgi:Domain of unknown function (DUF4382)
MTLKKSLVFLVLAGAFSLGSCSGLNSHHGGGGGGNATVLVTFTATPLTPPASTNLLAFSVNVAGISLTPSAGGTPINLPLNTSTFSVDLTRLQSDSAFVAASTSIAAGTYSTMTVSLANPLVTYCTQTTGAAGCTSGTVATVSSGAAAAPQITTTPFPITLTSNQTEGLAININLQKVLTVATNQTVTAVNLGATGAVTTSTLPPSASSLPPGPLSFIEDVTGVVTSVNASTQSVTVKTATRGSFTAVANSSTVFSPNCTNFSLSLTFASCVVQGQVASLDMELDSNGTFTLLEYDPLDTATGDWIEGVITATPTLSTQLQLVANDFVVSTSSSVIGSSLVLGDPVNVTLASPSPFAIDSKGYVVVTNSFGGTDATVLQPGEAVAVHLTKFTAASGSTFATGTANFLYLRFSRVTAIVASGAATNVFSIQNFPPFFGVTIPVNVQLSTGAPSTNFDGISGSSGLTASATVSMSALYFGPPTATTSSADPFTAAKVRVP